VRVVISVRQLANFVIFDGYGKNLRMQIVGEGSSRLILCAGNDAWIDDLRRILGLRSRKGKLLTVRRPCHHLAWLGDVEIAMGPWRDRLAFPCLDIDYPQSRTAAPVRCESDVFSVRRPAGRRIAGSTIRDLFRGAAGGRNYPDIRDFAIVGLIDGSEHESNVGRGG